jgi:putative phage-type endonuclease
MNEVNIMNDLYTLWRILPEASRPFFEEEHLKALLGLMGKTVPTETLWDFMRLQRQLRFLRSLTFAPQRSPEWLALRKNLLTASDLAGALSKSKFISRPRLVQSKAEARVPMICDCDREREESSVGGAGGAGGANAASTFTHPALSWGTMFEPMIARIYAEKHDNITLYDFGLIPHPTLKCFGASPDGITEFGKMVEIKCPWRRVIQDGEVPEQYYLQIQGQLSVCQLDECDYIEVVMEDITSESAYYECVGPEETHAHGVILELQVADKDTYDYSPPGLTPKEAMEWSKKTLKEWIRKDPTLNIRRVRPWKMKKMNLVPVRFNPELWESLVPQIQTFWNEVEQRTETLMNTPTAMEVQTESKPRARKQAKYTYRDDDE